MKVRIRRWLVISLVPCAILFALWPSAEAQELGRVFRLGFLDSSTASGSAALVDAFRQELSKLGWTEGKNISIEYRFAEQKDERLPELATELVRLYEAMDNTGDDDEQRKLIRASEQRPA